MMNWDSGVGFLERESTADDVLVYGSILESSRLRSAYLCPDMGGYAELSVGCCVVCEIEEKWAGHKVKKIGGE